MQRAQVVKSELSAQPRPLVFGLTRRQWRSALTAYLFLAPGLLLLGLFTFYPVVFGTVLSLYRYNLRTLIGLEPAQFVGLQHFRTIWGDRLFWIAMTNS